MISNTAFDSYIRKTLIPRLKAYINPGVVPLFLAYDVVFGGAAGVPIIRMPTPGGRLCLVPFGRRGPDFRCLSSYVGHELPHL